MTNRKMLLTQLRCDLKTSLSIIFITLALFIEPQHIYAQDYQNTITFDNQSGDPALVKLLGPTGQTIEVPDKQRRTVKVSTGKYDLLVRYGSKPEQYRYSKGEPVTVTETDTTYSVLTITLHKVVDGNYETHPISAKEFESVTITKKGDDSVAALHMETQKVNKDATKDVKKWFLQVTDDEESMEKLIGNYIKSVYNVSPTYKFDEKDNMYLTYDLSENPKIIAVIDSRPSGWSEEGKKVTEKRVWISSFYVLPESAKKNDMRNKILELNNSWNNNTWVPHRIYITNDGFIAMQSSINVPGKEYQVHAELVRDILVRTVTFWNEYSKELAEVLKSSDK